MPLSPTEQAAIDNLTTAVDRAIAMAGADDPELLAAIKIQTDRLNAAAPSGGGDPGGGGI